MQKIRLGMVGVTGFGASHLRDVIPWDQEGRIEFVSFSDIRNDHTAQQIEELIASGKQYHERYQDLLQDQLDVVIISTPLHLHYEMAAFFLEAGVHIYLEKPPVVLLHEVDKLLEIQKRTGAICQVGFQVTSTASVRRLIDLFRTGQLGAIQSIHAIGQFVRKDGYYLSSSWKGKLQLNGNPILDGSVMNPLSHLLNISLYFAAELGLGQPASVRSELYRGHDFIESEDTCSAVFEFDNGVPLGYYTTLCAPHPNNPYVKLCFDEGEVHWSYQSYYIYHKGKLLEGPSETGDTKLLQNLLDHLDGQSKLYMSLEMSRTFVLAANAIFAASGGITTIPESSLIIEGEGEEKLRKIIGIEQIMEASANRKQTFSEWGVEWAKPAQQFKLRDLTNDWKSWVY